jgi:hypothetical protein
VLTLNSMYICYVISFGYICLVKLVKLDASAGSPESPLKFQGATDKINLSSNA